VTDPPFEIEPVDAPGTPVWVPRPVNSTTTESPLLWMWSIVTHSAASLVLLSPC